MIDYFVECCTLCLKTHANKDAFITNQGQWNLIVLIMTASTTPSLDGLIALNVSPTDVGISGCEDSTMGLNFRKFSPPQSPSITSLSASSHPAPPHAPTSSQSDLAFPVSHNTVTLIYLCSIIGTCYRMAHICFFGILTAT